MYSIFGRATALQESPEMISSANKKSTEEEMTGLTFRTDLLDDPVYLRMILSLCAVCMLYKHTPVILDIKVG